jgi:hypothetical protein
MSRWLSPTRAMGVFFLAQLVIWILLFPLEPTLSGAAPKYWSAAATLKYLTLALTLLAAGWVGAVAVRSRGRAPLDPPGRHLQAVSIVALALALIGELVYARDLILYPAQLLVAFQFGSVADLGEAARSTRIVGLSSLSNLLLVPLAIHGQLLFADVSVRVRRHARWVVGTALVVLAFQGLLLAGRMALVNAILVLVAAWLARPVRRRLRRPGVIAAAAVALAVLLWAGETLRGGVTFAVPRGVSPLSGEAQAHVAERLAQGYFGADLNNAFRLLDCEPAMQVVGSTPFRFVLSNPRPPDDCPLWQSAYGTVNIVGLAWWDLGWLAFPGLALGGMLLGLLYGFAAHTVSQATRLLFLIAVPGYAGLLRLNWYASTAFLIPLGFLVAAYFFRAVLRGVAVRQRPAELGAS